MSPRTLAKALIGGFMICPNCKKNIDDKLLSHHLASKGGSSTSKLKKKTAIENGKKGGRPKKIKEEKK